MILADHQILSCCHGHGDKPMIDPCLPVQAGKPSYGLGSFGYDIRLGEKFLVPVLPPRLRRHKSIALSPLADRDSNRSAFVAERHTSKYRLRPHSFVLAESVETFNMPDDVVGICCGKSSYARLGILVNVTPLEPGWNGVLTIEIANLGYRPVDLVVGAGIAQIVFYRGEKPVRNYTNKEGGGTYQNQVGVTLPR